MKKKCIGINILILSRYQIGNIERKIDIRRCEKGLPTLMTLTATKQYHILTATCNEQDRL